MAQSKLAFNMPLKGERTCESGARAFHLQELPAELIVLVGDGSVTMFTKLALTCKEIKQIMVSGVAACKGLRLSAKTPRLAFLVREGRDVQGL